MLKVRFEPGWILLSVAVLVAFSLDALVLVWALATVLSPSCGNDVAWATTSALAALATVVAVGGVVAAVVRWRRLRAERLAPAPAPTPAGAGWSSGGTAAYRAAPVWPALVFGGVVLLGVLAAMAAFTLPTGGCG